MSVKEFWRPVIDWEDLYEVSTLGRVRSRDRIAQVLHPRTGRLHARRYRGVVLKQFLHSAGYPQVGLCRNGKKITRVVHELVCEAFHGRRPGDLQVAHWDGDRSNAASANLRWATRKDNEADKLRHGTRIFGDRLWCSKLTPGEVFAIREAAARGERRADIAARFRIGVATVTDIHSRRSWAWLD